MKLAYFDLSLAQLGDIQITSLAKKPQKLSLAASSVYVLNQEDIRRSGVTTIPDALRMVPGVQVAKLDANKWAISIRGFNDIFSNKLLVLMDGRSVYSPFFGGTYWDTVDTVLEDIERIEVIRGPGGTLWGANAVNGVINIISKKAKDSAGLFVEAIVGNEERGTLSIRYGDDINQQTNYRVYIKGFEKDEADNGVDDWRMGRAGVRIDNEVDDEHALTILGDVYAGEEGERAMSDINIAPFGTFTSKTDVSGGNISLRWQKYLDDESDFVFQSYYDRTEREHFYVKDQRNTVDLDFQHRFGTLWDQEIIWGLGYRYIEDETSAGTVMKLMSEKRSDRIFSAFLQDEIRLIDDELILTLGSKFEHNSYTGFEYQPSIRVLWKPYEHHSVWGAISRAVRVPSRIEQDITLQRTMINPSLALNIFGNRKMKSEELIAYEVGYRFLERQYSLDISFFYNDYDRLRSIETGTVIIGAPNVLPLVLDNKLHGEAYGLEIAASWQVFESWRLFGGYSFVQLQLHPDIDSNDNTEEADENDTPHHQLSLRSLWKVSEDWQLDTHLRYVDLVRAASVTAKKAVKSYLTIDLRAAWQVHESVTVSLVGQNLFGKHKEFRGSTVDIQATGVDPSIFVKAALQF